MGTKYIYFAGDNLIGTKYYRKAIIVGETVDLARRQFHYMPGKGMYMPKTGDLKSYAGAKGLLWPFLDYIEAKPPLSDRDVHSIFVRYRPFTDFVYPIRDMEEMHTTEAFGFIGEPPLEDGVERLKRLLLEYLA